jgi:hypothetical protein
VGFYARDRKGFLTTNSLVAKFFPQGGVLASAPSGVSLNRDTPRNDVAAIIKDHERPGVWWRFNEPAYRAPCSYNEPGTCAQCGCSTPGKPRCDL